jgi:hypothetical protein
MTPSFISAHMTFMNIDYKYFAGSKDPINIINKYRMRGFGCWLNKNELNTYIKYIYEVPFWNNLLAINPNNKHSYNKCFGPLNYTSNIFKPRMFNSNLITNEKIIPVEYDYNIKNYSILNEEEYNLHKFKYKEPLSNILRTINKDTGYIEPLQRNIINIYYDKINSKQYNDSVEQETQQAPPQNNMDWTTDDEWPAPQTELMQVATQVVAIDAQLLEGQVMAQTETAQAQEMEQAFAIIQNQTAS